MLTGKLGDHPLLCKTRGPANWIMTKIVPGDKAKGWEGLGSGVWMNPLQVNPDDPGKWRFY